MQTEGSQNAFTHLLEKGLPIIVDGNKGLFSCQLDRTELTPHKSERSDATRILWRERCPMALSALTHPLPYTP